MNQYARSARTPFSIITDQALTPLRFDDADRMDEIRNLKKLRAEGNYYRIRLGDYRIGLTIEGDTVCFVRILHRSEIYRYFP